MPLHSCRGKGEGFYFNWSFKEIVSNIVVALVVACCFFLALLLTNGLLDEQDFSWNDKDFEDSLIESNDFAYFDSLPLEYRIDADISPFEEDLSIFVKDDNTDDESPFHSEDFDLGFGEPETINKNRTDWMEEEDSWNLDSLFENQPEKVSFSFDIDDKSKIVTYSDVVSADSMVQLSKLHTELKQQIQITKEEIKHTDALFKSCAKDLEDNLKYTKQLEEQLENKSQVHMDENNSFIEEINKVKTENIALKHQLRFSLDKFEELHSSSGSDSNSNSNYGSSQEPNFKNKTTTNRDKDELFY